ncbi:MAG: hypothetical protein P4L53_00170 [Candidatus Obscuribacterales bacterium]|nr:hypothetical protein [Candidatus Obscuribacterales bacterium]
MINSAARLLRSTLAAAALAMTLPLVTLAEEEIKASESKNVSVTVYNQNFGIVREVRNLTLKDGVNYLRFEDVAEKIDPTTVSFKSLTAPDSVAVVEQNYQYDVLNVATVLDKSVGKKLTIKHYGSDGRVTSDTGILLAPPHESGSLMIKTDGGVVLNSSGEVEIGELPSGMVPKPSLLWKLMSQKAGEHAGEIAYQTQGLNWRCDYVAIVDESETKTDLNGWVTIDNQSGASYKHAALKLLAGDVHMAEPRDLNLFQVAPGASMVPPPPPGGAPFQENSFSEYHLYSLNGQTDLNDKETKQISLFSAGNIGANKRYVFDSQTAVYIPVRESDDEQLQKVAVKLEVQNGKANGLGMPLPKGRVRIFKKDKDGALQLIGEDDIDHTPVDEKVRLKLGDSFDLVALHKETNRIVLSNKENHSRASYEITLRNHKKTDVTINCVEHASGQWKIINSSHPYVKKTADVFEFAVPVRAGGEATVTYTIDTKN